MSFLLRAALVIGALSWMALQRQGSATPDLPQVDKAALEATALAAWEAIPEPARTAALHEGGAEIARRAGSALATAPVSRDTLLESDRTLPWRGAPTRSAGRSGERSTP